MKRDLAAQIKVDFEKAFSIRGTAVSDGIIDNLIYNFREELRRSFTMPVLYWMC